MACAFAGMTSTDGKCHTFDESANGYCRGEGCGAIVLKRLSDAVREGSHVYAVVKGSAVMQDGKSASLTAPSGKAQERLLRTVLSEAGVSPHEVKYLEAHGTGTKLGDPIETEAIASVYGSGRPDVLGVRRIVLVSRSGKIARDGQGLEKELRWLLEESGSEVLLRQCDVSRESELSSLLRELRSLEGGISGVVHSAGVLRDALLRDGKAAAGSSEVWQSKAESARLLHRLTSEDKLELFVSYSSIAAALGNIG
eukprot:gene11055-10857_t